MKHIFQLPKFDKKRHLLLLVMVLCLLPMRVYAESARNLLNEAYTEYNMGNYKESIQAINDLFTFSAPDKIQQAEAWKVAALDYYYLGKTKMAKYAYQQLRLLSPGFSFSKGKYPREVVDFFSDGETPPVPPAGKRQPLTPRVSSANETTPRIDTTQTVLSCTHKDNLEKGCCCFKGTHTYLFAPRYITGVLARFDTGKGMNCRSKVHVDINQGKGWRTVRTVQAVSSKGNNANARMEVWFPVNATLRGVRISDGCACCIDFSEIVLNAPSPSGTQTPSPNTAQGTGKTPANPWIVNTFGQIFVWTGAGWRRIPGHAKDIGVGADGSAWIISGHKTAGGYRIFHWRNGRWVGVPGGAVRIDVGPDGRPWIVNSSSQIFRWTGKDWMVMPGRARDIGIGSDGSAWIIGVDKVKGGYAIYRWRQGTWKRVPGGGVRIDVGPDGRPWVVNGSSQIFRWTGKDWMIMPGSAQDVGIGSDGSAWIIGVDRVKGGYAVYHWAKGLWKRVPGGAVAVSANPGGPVHPVAVTEDPTQPADSGTAFDGATDEGR